MRTLVGSGLNRKRVLQILKAINGKWRDASTVTEVQSLARDILEKFDPEYAHAADQLLDQLGAKAEDIDPTILPRSSMNDLS